MLDCWSLRISIDSAIASALSIYPLLFERDWKSLTVFTSIFAFVSFRMSFDRVLIWKNWWYRSSIFFVPIRYPKLQKHREREKNAKDADFESLILWEISTCFVLISACFSVLDRNSLPHSNVTRNSNTFVTNFDICTWNYLSNFSADTAVNMIFFAFTMPKFSALDIVFKCIRC